MEFVTQTGGTIFNVMAGLYLLAVLLRFLLQVAKADFYNPVSQAVVRVTNPLVQPLRKIIPGFRGIDFSSLILALLVEAVAICVLAIIYYNTLPTPGQIITWSVVGVLKFTLDIYTYAILASIIMSFVMMFSGSTNPHPILRLIWQLTEPVMAPFRRILPPMGGLDFSPILVFLAIGVLTNALYGVFGVTQLMARLVVGL
ncbi:MAG: YggT family protein [Pseudohongiellaceae bacterium]